MSIELKIKSKHLALEPAIIRNEERKLKKRIAWAKANGQDSVPLEIKRESLSEHRRKDVRNEARATFLARGYLAGKAYRELERTSHKGFDSYALGRILAMVQKYGSHKTTSTDIWAWIYTRAV